MFRFLNLAGLSGVAMSTIIAADLNVADPDKHPYADPAGGREGHPLAGETVNEARLYDFNSRFSRLYVPSVFSNSRQTFGSGNPTFAPVRV